jgi:hypothetical protein
MQQIGAAEPLLVWDTMLEWGDKLHLTAARSMAHIGALVIDDIHGRLAHTFRVGYCGPVTAAHFEAFCRLAWVWLRSRRGNVLVVEELADVTAPGKAPAAWGEIVRKNRRAGGRVYALTQRPAESDKTIVGNAAVLHAGRMNTARDRKWMAECLDVPAGEVAKLKDLDYIERDMRTHELRRGVIRFAAKTRTSPH